LGGSLCLLLLPLLGWSQVVISQLYGNGGNSGAVYKNDFVELYNRGTASVPLAGYAIQYASATGTTYGSNKLALTGSIAAGGYYLIQLGAGSGGTTALPTPDVTGSINMSGSAGKLALTSSTTSITSAADASVVDFVGFGTTANEKEGSSPAPAVSANTQAQARLGSGSTDTNQNGADFVVQLANPRNSASPVVTTTAPTGPGTTTATAGGTVLLAGTPALTGRGVVVGTAISPRLGGTGVLTFADGAATTGAYATSLTGLTAGTAYYATAYATNAAGTSYGNDLAFSTTAAGSSITTGTPTGTPVCATAAATITVPFTSNGTFTGTYSVQLSDASGSFAAPTALATTGTASPLTATIAAGTASGTGYKVRVVNDNPTTTGTANATAFTIVSNPTVTIAPGTGQTIAQGASLSFTGTETPAATSRQWLYGTASGSYGTATGITTTTYTFTPSAAGTYYVVLRSVFAGCGAVTSAETQVTVTAPQPLLTASPTTLSGFAAAQGAASAAQAYTLAGTNLPAGGSVQVSLPASSGYEVSADNTTFGPTASLSYAGTALPTGSSAPKVYVRLAATTAVGAYNGVAVTNTVFDNASAATTTAATVTVSGDVTTAPTITTTAVAPALLVPGSSVTVSYSTAGVFGAGNVFSAELSTAAGTFPGTTLATTASAAGSLTATLPTNAAAGSSYAIRVNASSPATTGAASAAFAITAGVFEPFEAASTGTSYVSPAAAFAFSSGSWTLFQALTGSSGSEAYRGTQSIRVRGGGYAQYSKANGVGVVSLYAATYGSDTNVSFALSYSTDGGTTFTAVPGTPAAGALPAYGATHSFTTGPYSYTLNVTGSVLLRIANTNATVAAGTRINFDDVTITDYVNTAPTLKATPTTLAISATTGQVATGTYTLSGQNLPAGTTVAIASPDPSLLVSVDGGATYAATATSSAATASGDLSQVVSVQFTAPATGGTTTATLTNDVASLGLAAPVTVTATAVPIVTYTWTGATSTSWSEPTNWTPTRTTTTGNDILVFDGQATATPTVTTDFASPQTIGQLQFSNGVSATFRNPDNRVLTISNLATGPDLTLAAGTTLTVFNPAASTTATGLTLQLATGATASIGGTLVFDAATASTTGTGAHRLLGSGAANSIEFGSGSVFSARANFAGSAFGTATALANNVVFRNGARYEQLGGSNPFALTQPASITVLEPASTYVYGVAGTVPPSLSGRTFGNLEYNVGNGNANASTVANAVTIAGNLVITTGDVGLNLTGGVNLQGNVLVNGGSSLTFAPGSGATVQLNGTTAQTFGGTAPAGALTFGPNATLQLNNAAGLVLARSLTLSRLTLTSGLLSTDAVNLLTLTSGATLLPATPTAASFVNGPLARATAAGAGTTLFPIGRNGAYRPLTLAAATQAVATTYTAVQTTGGPADQTLLAPLARISSIRYFSLTPSPAPAQGGFSGTIQLSFGADDAVNTPAAPSFVVAKSDGSGWSSIGRSANTSSTLTSDSFTDFSDFILASTDANAAVNPLPVALTSFGASRASAGVQLRWTTASELHSAYFEVERSLDGVAFTAVARVAAAGSAALPRTYTAADATAPLAVLYYRLRQVDQDGTAAYSPTLTVATSPAAAATGLELALSPNPAHESLSFSTGQPTAYTVRTALGQAVLQGTTAGGASTVPVAGLPAGVYFFELHTSAGRVVRRFVKD